MIHSIEYKGLEFAGYDEIIRVWTEAGLGYKPKGRDSREHINMELKASPTLFIGAYHGGKLIGTVLGSYDGRRGCVNRLAIVPNFRREGIAQELIARCEEELRKLGAKVIYCLIEKENEPSLTLFRSLGYNPHDGLVFLTKRESPDV